MAEKLITAWYGLKASARIGSGELSAPVAANLQAGQDSWDERTAHLYESGWRDIRHAEIVLPSQFEGDDRMGWAKHRSLLWNMAEYAENESDARVARGYTGNLPVSLTHGQRRELTKDFAQALADRYQVAVDFAVHDPHPGPEQKFHMHLLATTREVKLEGFGRIAMSGNRYEAGQIRELWTEHLTKGLQASFVEEGLERARLESRNGGINTVQRRARDWLRQIQEAQGARNEPDRIQQRTVRADRKSDYSL